MRDLGAEHLVAEILDQQKPPIEIEGVDGGRGKPAPPELVPHGDEGGDVLGEMHERAIGFAVADRRSVRLARCVHQDGAAVRQHETRVSARRGIALQILGGSLGVGCCIDEIGERAQALEPRGPAAVSSEHHAPAIRLCRLVHGDVEPVSRKPVAGALWPFDDGYRAWQHIVEAELGKLARLEPVKVAMMHGEARGGIGLHQREGWARHLALDAEASEQKPGEARLAGAERARHRDQVAWLEHESEPLGETVELDEVDAVKAPICAHPARLDP